MTSFNITGREYRWYSDITVKPDSNDVIPVRNQIIEIDIVGSSTIAEVDTYAQGTTSAGVGYTTNASTASVGMV